MQLKCTIWLKCSLLDRQILGYLYSTIEYKEVMFGYLYSTLECH